MSKRALQLPSVVGISIVAASLLSVVACGAPANNAGLFGASGGGPVASGGGASESGGGTSSAGNTSGTAGNSGSAGAMPGGGGGTGGNPTGGAPNGGAPNGGAPNGGAPNGGAPNGGNAGSPGSGAPNGGGGGMQSDCSTFAADATFYSETKHCYLVVRDLATFADARTHCTSLGAHLVTLSDQQENDFVWSLDSNEHWIGTTDGKGPKENTPGTYTWVDGEPFTYTNWSEGQPNASQTTCGVGNGGGNCYEHCGFQWSGGAAPGEWNDRLCLHTIEAVCEWDD